MDRTRASLWLEIGQNADPQSVAAMPPSLDEGERATIAVASAIKADLILMDDREGVKFARAQGFAVTGTLGVLDLAAQRDLINLAEACMRLRDTTFHYRQGLLDALLAQRRESES